MGALFALVRVGLLATLGVLAILGWQGVAAATGAPATLHLTARPAPRRAPAIELVAHLAHPVGAALGSKATSLGGVTISFSLHVTEFSGSPLLVLGSTTTDAKGEAIFTYEPTWTGRQELVASATDAAGTTLASTATSISVARATHGLALATEAVRPDGSIGRVVVAVLLAIVVLLWLVLVTVFVRVHRGVGARPT
ncbi:MAG: hypothetical protein ACYCST_12265 [Acidimicrobiales bacterium]